MHRLFLLFLTALPFYSAAQEKGLPRVKIVVLQSDTIVLDTLSLVPGSVSVLHNGLPLPPADFRIDHASARLILLNRELKSDSVSVLYSVYPLLFTAEKKHKDLGKLRADPDGNYNPFLYNPATQKTQQDLFKVDGLNKSGSISRGISFGNNQDVVVNSNLNLQLSGKLTDNIELLMAATDDNIPIQPDGNTQQLQDFDKVYIQLSDKRTKLIAGDFQASRPNSYFMNFNKRAQGLFIGSKQPLGKDTLKNGRLLLTGSAAVSRGKFGRQIFQGIEGNQGPYRLRGAENELFIVVLSGTEKVFIDGVLLKRGQEYDYIIDYNTAEVTFTARQFITKDKRIVVEFQYSDRNYARSLLHAGADYKKEKLGLRINFYNEQDNRNQPLQQQLTQADKLVMAAVGDTLSSAVVQGADSIEFNDDEVLYKKRDTIANSVLYPGVFVYSVDPDSAFYRVSFSNVGQGNGDYVLVSSAANGRVFRWTAPVGNIRQGAYAPLIQLITPKKKQMITGAADFQLGKKTRLGLEGAFSRNDLNTFSRIDSKDDDGYAGRLVFQHDKEWGDSLPWKLTATADYELVNRFFSQVERFRSAEFERDWNLGWGATRPVTGDQHIAGAGISLGRKNRGTAGYCFNTFLEGSDFTGIRHVLNGLYNRKGFSFSADGSYLDTKGSAGATNFIRQKARVSQRIGKIRISLRDELEQNLVHKPSGDTLQPLSFSYFEWEASAGNSDTTRNRYSAFYKQRTDFLPLGSSLQRATFAESAGMTIELLKHMNHQFRTTTAVRRLDISNSALTVQKPDQSLVGRVEYSLRAWKGVLTSSTFYEAGSGLEQKKEFTYIEVAPGQGAFTWTDYNGNNVKELNEFEIAQFPDQATFIRVFVPTNEYIKVYSNQFSQSIQLRPGVAWSAKKGVRKTIALFSNQTVYRIDRKTTEDINGSALNPFEQETADTSLVSLGGSFRSTTYFNQMGSKFGFDYSRQDIRGKTLLTNGLESRAHVFDEGRLRWNFTRVLSLQTVYRRGTKSTTSEFFSSRNFDLHYFDAEPRFSIQPGTSFRVGFNYRYSEKRNHADLGGQFAVVNKGGVELKYNVLSKGSFLAEANYFHINFNSAPNTSIAYEMLEGLKAGKNITWKLTWQRTLANNMQLNIGYDGRKSPGIKTIHTGSAQVRAYF
ncbi:MAG: hypothetical protein FD123_540 [Bacteroidetes bacterium]|nr:MAG: hypothetical protein FD123_540 [Bacteroidota bacterium]